ncbi:Protein kinase C-like phorbol ester/diacylglycerol-binding domain, partial [Arabidopsis thaliana x Arabidopsis arenosa]
MDSEGVLMPLIHEHLMMPWNDLRRGRCCGRFEAISNGYYCKTCDFFVHKKCGDEASKYIEHPSHPNHTLQLLSNASRRRRCNLCGRHINYLSYSCEICKFNVDLHCAMYPPPEFIEISERHHHKLTLLKELIAFMCDDVKCGKLTGSDFAYVCHECDLTFHVDCIWHPSKVYHTLELNHSYHPWHSLTLLTGQPPEYSDGACRLCARKIDERFFYHCSSCNFTLDMRCVLHPPLQSLLNLKAHDHQLTLLPRLDSFTCNACGLKGDRSPYVCFQCGFMIHQDCLDLPRVININRHDHRVSRTSVLGVVNSVCGVCRQKVDWTCGGFSCQRCPGYVIHSKCATRRDVWNGKELEGIPEEIEDIEPYVVIDDNTIQHFSHKEHYLRLHVNGVLCDDNKRCRACTHPICLQSFYGCMDCDFILHQNCAGFLRMKWHVLHNERLTLVTNEDGAFRCYACDRLSNGFRYQHGNKTFDVRCVSISEPFDHPSHPDHPLYLNLPDGEIKICNNCNQKSFHELKCIEDDCRFAVCFECATFPQVVKHRVDDHPLSLCYGEKASGKFWCDICERETNPETWFYTCKDHRASLHTMCVLGELSGLMPRSTIEADKSYEVVLNNSISRPLCSTCKMHCICPIILKTLGSSDAYFCSLLCVF